jgi:hypothetical protein
MFLMFEMFLPPVQREFTVMNSRPVEAAVLRRQSHHIITNLSIYPPPLSALRTFTPRRNHLVICGQYTLRLFIPGSMNVKLLITIFLHLFNLDSSFLTYFTTLTELHVFIQLLVVSAPSALHVPCFVFRREVRETTDLKPETETN